MVAILWILIGITICSIFVASLSTTIMASQNPPTPDMMGARVGLLKGRVQEAVVIAQHGGILHPVSEFLPN